MVLNKFLKMKNAKGFTFIELVVVLGIFAILSSVVLFNFKDFSSGVDLQNLSQQIAMQVSNMQRKTLAGSQYEFAFTGLGGGRWIPSYGVCFKSADATSNECGLSSQQYVPGTTFVVFADNNNDKIYDNAPLLETIDIIEIKGGEYISEICSNEGDDCGGAEARVVYTRPNVSPEIYYGQTSVRDISVQISSENGATRKVNICKSGQIEAN